MDKKKLKPRGNTNYTYDIKQILVDLVHETARSEQFSNLSKGNQSLAFPSFPDRPLLSKQKALDELTLLITNEKKTQNIQLLLSLGKTESSSQNQLFKGLSSCIRMQNLFQIYKRTENDAFEIRNPDSGEQSLGEQHEQNQAEATVIDIVLKANSFLFELMPQMITDSHLETSLADLLPLFIENLGSQKAIVRKSTHKCIGTYVKLTQKLEFVIELIIKHGLQNQNNSRTRQHSMLVIPALLSLKSSIIEKEQNKSLQDLLNAVLVRVIEDQSDTVVKTAKKLILELQKCYPESFQNHYVNQLESLVLKNFCEAIFQNDEKTIKEYQEKLLYQQQNKNQKIQQVNDAYKISFRQDHQLQKEEITEQSPPEQIFSEEKEQNDKYEFGIFDKKLISSLRIEKLTPLQERCLAIQELEQILILELQNSDKKRIFQTYCVKFLQFLLPLINENQFKICLTALSICNKLLAIDLLNLEISQDNRSTFDQLIISLFEKLADSKVIIRQQILKAMASIIKYRGQTRKQQNIKEDDGQVRKFLVKQCIAFLQRENWQIREGVLHILATCMIVQAQIDELNINKEGKTDKANELNFKNYHITKDLNLFKAMISVVENEQRPKVQQMAYDTLALCQEISQSSKDTSDLIFRVAESDLGTQKATNISNRINLRQNSDSLPLMQIDGSIEFKSFNEIENNLKSDKPIDNKKDLKVVPQKTEKVIATPSSLEVIPTRLRATTEISVEQVSKQQIPQQSKKGKEQLETFLNVLEISTKQSENTRQSSNLNNLNNQTFQGQIEQTNKPEHEKIQEWLPTYDHSLLDKLQIENQISQDKPLKLKRRQVSLQSNQENNSNKPSSIPRQDQNIKINSDLQTINLETNNDQILIEQNLITKSELQWMQKEPKSAALKNSNNLGESTSAFGGSINKRSNIQMNKFQDLGYEQADDQFERIVNSQNTVKPRILYSNDQSERQQRIMDKYSNNSPLSPKNNGELSKNNNHAQQIVSSQHLINSTHMNQTKMTIGHHALPSAIGAGLENTVVPHFGGRLVESDSKSLQVKNMSQSSGASGAGFGVNKAQINERLKLLKSSIKYKNQNFSELYSDQQYGEDQSHVDFPVKIPNSSISSSKVGEAGRMVLGLHSGQAIPGTGSISTGRHDLINNFHNNNLDSTGFNRLSFMATDKKASSEYNARMIDNNQNSIQIERKFGGKVVSAGGQTGGLFQEDLDTKLTNFQPIGNKNNNFGGKVESGGGTFQNASTLAGGSHQLQDKLPHETHNSFGFGFSNVSNNINHNKQQRNNFGPSSGFTQQRGPIGISDSEVGGGLISGSKSYTSNNNINSTGYKYSNHNSSTIIPNSGQKILPNNQGLLAGSGVGGFGINQDVLAKRDFIKNLNNMYQVGNDELNFQQTSEQQQNKQGLNQLNSLSKVRVNHGPIKARPLDRNINISEVKSELNHDEIKEKEIGRTDVSYINNSWHKRPPIQTPNSQNFDGRQDQQSPYNPRANKSYQPRAYSVNNSGGTLDVNSQNNQLAPPSLRQQKDVTGRRLINAGSVINSAQSYGLQQNNPQTYNRNGAVSTNEESDPFKITTNSAIAAQMNQSIGSSNAPYGQTRMSDAFSGVTIHQQSSSTQYIAPQEPLIRPEIMFSQAVENLKQTADWQKAFDGLNIVKRVAQFHKELLSMNPKNILAKECIQHVVKQTENLRSQVAKNACMTLQVIYSELCTRDLDINLDLVLQALLKAATHTNNFISEQADKALTMVCHACTESKILNTLQNVDSRSNQMKMKVAKCLSSLIEKLGTRIASFKDNNRLIKMVLTLLNESAQETRQQAKIAILLIKSNLSSLREFESLLAKSGASEKQIEQAKKIAEQTPQDLLKNVTTSNFGYDNKSMK